MFLFTCKASGQSAGMSVGSAVVRARNSHEKISVLVEVQVKTQMSASPEVQKVSQTS